MNILLNIIHECWNILCLSAPYMLFGFFIAGLLKAYIPDDFIARHLGQDKRRNLFKAAALGVPIPLCSCGVLPAAAGIRKQGASKGATTAFLISTPETGVDSISVTYALLDPLMAIIRPVAAFLTAITTGQFVRIFDPDPTVPQIQQQEAHSCGCSSTKTTESSCCSATKPAINSPLNRFKKGMSFAFGDLFGDIAGWFFFGIVIAGLITLFLSPALVENWLGNHFIAMFVMLVVSMPLYVCATASTPIAAALVLKGLNPGAALVFLLAGPATNAAAISVISKILGRRATLTYVSGIIISSIILGIVVDVIYANSGLTSSWHIGQQGENYGLTGIISAIILIAMTIIKKLQIRKTTSCCSDSGCSCH